jgi:hypothetical protein
MPRVVKDNLYQLLTCSVTFSKHYAIIFIISLRWALYLIHHTHLTDPPPLLEELYPAADKLNPISTWRIILFLLYVSTVYVLKKKFVILLKRNVFRMSQTCITFLELFLIIQCTWNISFKSSLAFISLKALIISSCESLESFLNPSSNVFICNK